jgi:hypothetical protein
VQKLRYKQRPNVFNGEPRLIEAELVPLALGGGSNSALEPFRFALAGGRIPLHRSKVNTFSIQNQLLGFMFQSSI